MRVSAPSGVVLRMHAVHRPTQTRSLPLVVSHVSTQQQGVRRARALQVCCSWAGAAGDGDAVASGSASALNSRFGTLFHNNHDGPPVPLFSSPSHNNGSDGSSTPAGAGAGAGAQGAVIDAAAPWVVAALLPTALWCLTWSLTGGMAALANSSMSGMVTVAAALHPALPRRGAASYEDVAASLIKAMLSGTDSTATWTTQGLGLPSWLLRALMCCFYSSASTSSGVASALIPNTQWLVVCGVCQGLMYAACLLLMLPLGSGLSSAAHALRGAVTAAAARMPALKLPAPLGRIPDLPRLSDTSALCLKLAGLLSWPCISTAAALQPTIAMPHLAAASTGGGTSAAASQLMLAALQVGCVAALLGLLLAAGAAAARFAADAGRRRAGADAVAAFGVQVGTLNAAACGLIITQIAIVAARGQAAPAQLVMPLISCAILARIAWTVARLQRLGSATPSMWLQLLSLTPEPRPRPPGTGASTST